MSAWSYEEINTLRSYYPTEGIYVKERLDRTPASIKSKCSKCKITKSSKWEDSEINVLVNLYPIIKDAVVLFLPNRTVLDCERAFFDKLVEG